MVIGSLDDLGQRLDPVDAPLPAALQSAAVVALLLPDPGRRVACDPRVVMIRRASDLRHHPGQIAFPGGKPESGDRDLADTALREASEEVGIDRCGSRIVGRLAPVPTPTGFFIVPFVGWAPSGCQPRVASAEVESILLPRLSTLADPAIFRMAGLRSWNGVGYELHEYAIADPPVWGATALVVSDLLRRLRP